MQLIGQLSRPSPRLQAALDPHDASDASYTPISPGPARRRLGNGVVQRAVFSVLAETGGPMRLADIQADVERLLGQPVSMESVSWSLRVDANGERRCFERVERGLYRLSALT
jgi:hypothetical protein